MEIPAPLVAASAWARRSEWALVHDPEAALLLIDRLGHFWFAQGHLAAELDLAQRVLASDAGPASAERARVGFVAAWLAVNLGDFARADPQADAALALAERLGEGRVAAYAR